ncbi:Calcium-Dependent Secretion Activator 1 [Manis pentadactyla]|nr:Calcium-Dependent Secretion Activator 1 [Manis pentadactyla]
MTTEGGGLKFLSSYDRGGSEKLSDFPATQSLEIQEDAADTPMSVHKSMISMVPLASLEVKGEQSGGGVGHWAGQVVLGQGWRARKESWRGCLPGLRNLLRLRSNSVPNTVLCAHHTHGEAEDGEEDDNDSIHDDDSDDDGDNGHVNDIIDGDDDDGHVSDVIDGDDNDEGMLMT